MHNSRLQGNLAQSCSVWIITGIVHKISILYRNCQDIKTLFCSQCCEGEMLFAVCTKNVSLLVKDIGLLSIA